MINLAGREHMYTPLSERYLSHKRIYSYNGHAHIPSWTRNLRFGMGFIFPNSMCANNGCSGETTRMHWLV